MRRFLDTEATEESQLNDPTLTLVESAQLLKRLIKGQQVNWTLLSRINRFARINLTGTAASFGGRVLAGMVHEDASRFECDRAE